MAPHEADFLTPYREAIEEALRASVQAPNAFAAPLYHMMQYHLGWLDANLAPLDPPASGKRFRPLLCLLACEATGGDWRLALPAAAAIELVHNFSLIHDDIEDGDAMRHHRPTVWRLWGQAQGINTGDALWALARCTFHRILEEGIEPAVCLKALAWFDRAGLALCTGQYLDMAFESQEVVSLEAYLEMISGKTAALMEASTAIGATLAGASDAVIQEMASFGRFLGLAFQMTDDLLGLWGDPAVTGKPVASDLWAHKKTLPIVLALEWEAARGEHTLADLYRRSTFTPQDGEKILALLEQAHARERTKEMAAQHIERAMAALERATVDSPARRALASLALSITDRAF